MNDLMVFSNDEFGEVRTVEINGEPWFVGKDIADALGYGKGKSLNNAVANHVDDEDKGVTEMMTPGGMQQMTIVNESGMYALIFGSKLPSAKKFKRWVTSEVLPSIRKTGEYKQEKNYDEHEKAKIEIDLVNAVSSVLHLNDISKVQLMKNVLINHNLPTYILPEYAESKGVMKSASQLLKENKIEMSAVKFNKLMKEKGFMKESFRDSSSGKQKKFNTLTNDTYGQNQVNVNNPKETQPMYYVDKFLELYKLITE